jgi:Restriction endonuclease
MTGRYDHDAEILRQQEFSRLSADTVPTLESLRFLNPTQLRARVADMLERLGYELVTPETAKDLLVIKGGEKHVVAFAATTDPLPTQANHLTELHRAIIAKTAAGGFFVTTRGFSRDAEAYAKTAPIKLVDGPKLVASIKRSMEGMPAPESYKAMCRECGDIVAHRLDKAEAITCRSGHAVAPTIARASLSVRTQPGGSTSRTYEPPRVYTRREMNAHNTKYIARKKKERKQIEPKAPAADYDVGPDPFGTD